MNDAKYIGMDVHTAAISVAVLLAFWFEGEYRQYRSREKHRLSLVWTFLPKGKG